MFKCPHCKNFIDQQGQRWTDVYSCQVCGVLSKVGHETVLLDITDVFKDMAGRSALETMAAFAEHDGEVIQ